MSEIIKFFRVFHDLPQNVINNIKIFYVTKQVPKLGYCVCKDDLVYGVGEEIQSELSYDNCDFSANYTVFNI